MKSSVALEIAALRAEIRRLQTEVEDLEARLAVTGEEAVEENPWNVWPYTWCVAGWQWAVQSWNTACDRVAIWQVERANLRTLRQHRQANHSLIKMV